MMNWVARLFERNKPSGRRSFARRNPVAKGRSAPPQAATHPYRAIMVYSRVACCDAARRLAGQKFLAAHAPQLPLGGCDHPASCQCRYRHLEDRRQEMRRDSDHGLPARGYNNSERRYRKDRRHDGITA